MFSFSPPAVGPGRQLSPEEAERAVRAGAQLAGPTRVEHVVTAGAGL